MAAYPQHHLPPVPASASTTIREATYSPETRELHVTFLSGRTYTYARVPQVIYEAYLASPSKTTFFNIAIRGRYHFHETSALAWPTSRR
jgi:hypothetical protein